VIYFYEEPLYNEDFSFSGFSTAKEKPPQRELIIAASL
jgi:hypothetical protein